jgi:CheY-like chemotaxis protein
MKNVLLVGESWVSAATHYKGFDQFGSVTFHLGAEPLVEAGAAVSEALIEAPDDHLSVLPLSAPVSHPRAFLSSPDWSCLLARLRREFDLVLLDHTIPHLTSVQELRLVLAQRATRAVIMHTGYIAPDMEEEALAMGVRQVVEKGELDPLWAAIERTLDHEGEPVPGSAAKACRTWRCSGP